MDQLAMRTPWGALKPCLILNFSFDAHLFQKKSQSTVGSGVTEYSGRAMTSSPAIPVAILQL